MKKECEIAARELGFSPLLRPKAVEQNDSAWPPSCYIDPDGEIKFNTDFSSTEPCGQWIREIGKWSAICLCRKYKPNVIWPR